MAVEPSRDPVFVASFHPSFELSVVDTDSHLNVFVDGVWSGFSAELVFDNVLESLVKLHHFGGVAKDQVGRDLSKLVSVLLDRSDLSELYELSFPFLVLVGVTEGLP